MTQKDLVKKFQNAMNLQGEELVEDGIFGRKTEGASNKFDLAMIVSKKPAIVPEIPRDTTHLSPLDWVRAELGQKEIKGSQDNPRIRWYHTHCANIGSKEHPDEVPWCSSFLNACADECGMKKTDNALAVSWKNYGVDSGDDVEAGDIVVIGSSHVTMANKAFNRKTDKYFEGIGGNQADSVNVSVFRVDGISACRKWVPKADTVTAPTTPVPVAPLDPEPVPVLVTKMHRKGFSTDKKILGIDISDYQDKPIDWDAVKKQGVDFVIIKATEGDWWKSKLMAMHAANVASVGIAMGFYHFFRMVNPHTGKIQDPVEQAQIFWERIKEYYAKDGTMLPPALDFESHDGEPSENDLICAKQFLVELERLSGITPIIYTGPYFFQSMGKTGLTLGFEKYMLWNAHYTDQDPLIPAPWPKFTFWQFTSDFDLANYPKGVDANWFDGNLADLKKILV